MTETNTEDQEVKGAAQPQAEAVPDDVAEALGDCLLQASRQANTICLTVRPERIADVCGYLRDRAAGAYPHLAALLGVDYGDELGVVYYLYELGGPKRVVIHARLPRQAPVVPSIVGVFPAAGWKEREAMEMFGIEFEGHPDPRKLLLPEGWEGHPLRKDYVAPDHPYLKPDPRHELT